MTIKISEMHDEVLNEVLSLRLRGLSYAKIGRRSGIPRKLVRQIVKGTVDLSAVDPKIMLMPSDVALLIGIHVNTVRRWSDKGILRSYHIGPRGDRRFRREDVDDFLKQENHGKVPNTLE